MKKRDNDACCGFNDQHVGITNLHDLTIPQVEGPAHLCELVDNSKVLLGVEVYFRDLERHLLRHIQGADVVLGCVAWLTSFTILDALATKENVSIIVQKEDFLRPDVGSGSDWKRRLRGKYDALELELNRMKLAHLSLSYCSDYTVQPVRCVGNHNRDKAPAFARMHNKFLVFGRLEKLADGFEVAPYAVWTGSFNLTRNATQSFENAVVLYDQAIVEAYRKEWQQIFALSEPLNWESDWCAPEWRIGS